MSFCLEVIFAASASAIDALVDTAIFSHCGPLFSNENLKMLTSHPRHCLRSLSCTTWRRLWPRQKPRLSRRRCWLVFCLVLVVLISVFWPSAGWTEMWSAANADALSQQVLQPAAFARATLEKDPEKWLRTNSNNHYEYHKKRSWRDRFMCGQWSSKSRAALISLVRNEELDGIMQSMRQLEYHWNYKYIYQGFSSTNKRSVILSK